MFVAVCGPLSGRSLFYPCFYSTISVQIRNDMENKDIFPEIRIVSIPERLCRIGRAVTGFFQMHQLASHGDHPFDHEIYDKGWPLESDGIDPALLNMNQMSFPEMD